MRKLGGGNNYQFGALLRVLRRRLFSILVSTQSGRDMLNTERGWRSRVLAVSLNAIPADLGGRGDGCERLGCR